MITPGPHITVTYMHVTEKYMETLHVKKMADLVAVT